MELNIIPFLQREKEKPREYINLSWVTLITKDSIKKSSTETMAFWTVWKAHLSFLHAWKVQETLKCL